MIALPAGVILGHRDFFSDQLVDEAAAKAVRDYRIASGEGRKPVRTLSGGNQQKVAVSRSFLREPTVILAYEPTQGVDVGSPFDYPNWSATYTFTI